MDVSYEGCSAGQFPLRLAQWHKRRETASSLGRKWIKCDFHSANATTKSQQLEGSINADSENMILYFTLNIINQFGFGPNPLPFIVHYTLSYSVVCPSLWWGIEALTLFDSAVISSWLVNFHSCSQWETTFCRSTALLLLSQIRVTLYHSHKCECYTLEFASREFAEFKSFQWNVVARSETLSIPGNNKTPLMYRIPGNTFTSNCSLTLVNRSTHHSNIYWGVLGS